MVENVCTREQNQVTKMRTLVLSRPMTRAPVCCRNLLCGAGLRVNVLRIPRAPIRRAEIFLLICILICDSPVSCLRFLFCSLIAA